MQSSFQYLYLLPGFGNLGANSGGGILLLTMITERIDRSRSHVSGHRERNKNKNKNKKTVSKDYNPSALAYRTEASKQGTGMGIERERLE